MAATTTGEKLVELSKLPTGTAMEHLLAITTGGGGGDAPTIDSVDITNTSGIGTDDGIIIISASNGILPYEYSIGGDYQSGDTFNNLSEGIYTLIVRDVSGFTDSIGGIQLSAPASETPIITEIVTTDASTQYSSDGSIRVIAEGGSLPYTYSINDGVYQTNNLFGGLSIGVYTIAVKDANNVVNRLSGIKISPKITGKTGGYGRGIDRHKPKVNIKNIKVKDVDLNENIEIRVII